MVAELKGLQEAADTTSKRLVRAGKLTGGLADEGVRWTATVAELEVARVCLIGDVFLSAAFIAYCGPFTAAYRKEVTLTPTLPLPLARTLLTLTLTLTPTLPLPLARCSPRTRT